ncbi:MAG TPA: hypothetical protein VFX06_07055 [Stellaceae bacterium]|jgi:hypothetical protein|nr:hypothetical protein [Stellaceae bacterium]
MRRIVAACAFFVVGLLIAGTAEAQCWWNGYYWNCYNEAYNFPFYMAELGTYPPYWYYYNPGGIAPVPCGVR